MTSVVYDGYRVLRRLALVAPEALTEEDVADLKRGLGWALYSGLVVMCGANLYLAAAGKQALDEATEHTACDESEWARRRRETTSTHRAPCAIPRYGHAPSRAPELEAICDVAAYARRIGHSESTVVEALLSGALVQCDTCGAIRVRGLLCCREVKPCQQ